MLNNFSLSSLNNVGFISNGNMKYVGTNALWENPALYMVSNRTEVSIDYNDLTNLSVDTSVGVAKLAISRDQSKLYAVAKKKDSETFVGRIHTLNSSGAIVSAKSVSFISDTNPDPITEIFKATISDDGSKSAIIGNTASGAQICSIIDGDIITYYPTIPLGVGGKTHGLVIYDSETNIYTLSKNGDVLYVFTPDIVLQPVALANPSTMSSNKFDIELKRIHISENHKEPRLFIYTADSAGELAIHMHDVDPSRNTTHQALSNSGIPINDVYGVHFSEEDGYLYVL